MRKQREFKTFIIDGTEAQLMPSDLNGDGIVGGIEKLSSNFNTAPLQPPSEIQGSFKEINKDIIEANNMSTIDTRANIMPEELSYILIYDFLISIGFMQSELGFLTRKKLRLSVSKDARARDDMVKIAQGQAKPGEKKESKLIKSIKNFMGRDKNEENS